ncbi:MAG: hypothetical protein U0R65_07895 [Candidatus Nanopelagicales bacterium]
MQFDPASLIRPDDLASAIDLLAFMGDMLTLALAADRERQDLHEALADSRWMPRPMPSPAWRTGDGGTGW